MAVAGGAWYDAGGGLSMKITRVHFKPASGGDEQEPCRAYATVEFDRAFVVKGLRVIQKKGVDRLLVAMPSRRRSDGSWADVCHPITRGFRGELEQAVLDAFDQWANDRVVVSEGGAG